jgi:hypothetical protein
MPKSRFSQAINRSLRATLRFPSQASYLLAAPLRFFLAPDVFISYSRQDGASYAEALAGHLAQDRRRYGCFIDQWETIPGIKIPRRILRAASWSRAAIIVGSNAALNSTSIDQEISILSSRPRAIVLIQFHNQRVEEAIWFLHVRGLAPVTEPGGEDALNSGKPSPNVLQRIENALIFWRRNNRIQVAAGGGIVVLCITLAASAFFGLRANAARQTAQAVELALRAEDMVAADARRTVDAVRLGLDSLDIRPTSWGESVVRKGLLLLPAFGGTTAAATTKQYVAIPKTQTVPARFGPNSLFVSWSYLDTAGPPDFSYEFKVYDATTGEPSRKPFNVVGFVEDVRFSSSGDSLIVATGSLTEERHGRLSWARTKESDVRELPIPDVKAFALASSADVLAVASSGLEVWKLDPLPTKQATWPLADATSVAVSRDGKSIFALAKNVIFQLKNDQPNARPETLTEVGNGNKASIYATDGHLVIRDSSKIKTWDLINKQWDHELSINNDAQILAIPLQDRLVVWGPAKLNIWDLSASNSGVSFYTDQIDFDCGLDRSREIRMLDFFLSVDSRKAAIACGDGIATVFSTADGVPLAKAPISDSVPRAVGLDAQGKSLFVYSTRRVFARQETEAALSRWHLVNRATERIGGAKLAKIPLSLAPAAGGTTLAATFAENGSAKLRVYDLATETLVATSDERVDGRLLSWVPQSNRIASGSTARVELWLVQPPKILKEDAFDTDGDIIEMRFGGDDSRTLAVSTVRGESAQLVLFSRGETGWRRLGTRDVRIPRPSRPRYSRATKFYSPGRRRVKYRLGSWALQAHKDAS